MNKERKVIRMERKYGYEVEFLSKMVSPTGTKYFSSTGECMLREMKSNFKSFLKENNLQVKGATKGEVLNAKGNVIGKFHFKSTLIQ